MAAWLQRLAEHLGPVVPNVFLGTKNRSKQLSSNLITARNSDEFARSLQEASPPPRGDHSRERRGFFFVSLCLCCRTLRFEAVRVFLVWPGYRKHVSLLISEEEK